MMFGQLAIPAHRSLTTIGVIAPSARQTIASTRNANVPPTKCSMKLLAVNRSKRN